MARIRSIKPEFWIDEKIVELSAFARLLFIGMWNFADDQGFLDHKSRRIKMQIFPADDVDIDALIDELLAAGMVIPHISPVGPVLQIVNWHHQRVDKPARARFSEDDLQPPPVPPPPAPGPSPAQTRLSTKPREESPNGHGGSRASLATEGKGSGSGVEGKGSGGDLPPSAGNSLALVPRPRDADAVPPATTDALVADWLDHCRKRPPGNVIGQIGKQVKTLLSEGIDPADVRAGLVAWHRRGVHPSVLPSMVNELMNASPAAARASPRPSTTDSRVNAALAIAADLERQEIES